MAMSLALIGLKVPGIVIDNPGCVAKTYPEFFDDLAPQIREVTGFEQKNFVARRKGIHDRRFPGSRPGSRIQDHMAGGLKNPAQALENFLAKAREFRTAMVDDRRIHGAQDSIRHIGRAWNLEKVASCMNHGGSV